MYWKLSFINIISCRSYWGDQFDWNSVKRMLMHPKAQMHRGNNLKSCNSKASSWDDVSVTWRQKEVRRWYFFDLLTYTRCNSNWSTCLHATYFRSESFFFWLFWSSWDLLIFWLHFIVYKWQTLQFRCNLFWRSKGKSCHESRIFFD